MATKAQSEQTRIAAIKEILDRDYGRPGETSEEPKSPQQEGHRRALLRDQASAADAEVDPWTPSPTRTPSWSITPPGTRIPPPAVVISKARAPPPIARAIPPVVNPNPVSRSHHASGGLMNVARGGEADGGGDGCKGVSGRAMEAHAECAY